MKRDTTLPSIKSLTADISRRWECDESNQIESNESTEESLTRCFFNHFSQTPTAFKSKQKDERTPHTFSEAWQHPMLVEAVDREFNALVERGIWTSVKQTPEMDPFPFTWTCRIKDASTISGILYKARCCLCGNYQKAFRDCDPANIYAPVVRHETIRLFFTKVAAQYLKVEGADVDNAYLYGDLDKPISMKQPSDSSGKVHYPGQVCLVVKSLYGARQASDIWEPHIRETLSSCSQRKTSIFIFFSKKIHFSFWSSSRTK